MTNLKGIADQLNISIATVSRAINGKPGVKPGMRATILATAQEMGYFPNSAARGLATASMKTIGFLSLDRSQPIAYDAFYINILHGVEEELSRLGYFMVVSTVDPASFDSPQDLPILREKRVDGIILPSSFFPPEFARKLKKMKVPLVLVDNWIDDPPIDCILADDENTGHSAAVHLLNHGYRKLVMLSGPHSWPPIRLRAAGFQRAVEEFKSEYGSPSKKPDQSIIMAETIYLSETTIDSGMNGMMTVLEKYPGTRAIFTANDAMAIGALRIALEAGKRVPEDLALISVDDIELARHVSVPLTTMHINTHRLGVLAARRLLELIRNPADSPVIIQVPTELTIRESCGC
jgi:LacI family transcriptional regulator